MMKYFRFFCLVSLIFLAFQTKAQYVPQTAAGYQFKGILADTLNSPVGCGSPVGRVNLIYKRSAFYTDSCNHRVYFYDPHRSAWDTLATAFGSGTDGSLTFEDVLNNGPDLTANHISNGNTNDFTWHNYGTYTIDAQTLNVPYLATPVENSNTFLAPDENGNIVAKQIEFPTDSSGQVDITHDFQRSLDDGNQLRHDDTVKGNSYAFLWDKVHHFSVMSGATFEFPYGNHSQIFLDSLSSYYYSQDTTGRSQVWASPQYAQIESANSDGDNSSISAWSNGGAMMKGSLADTLDAPVINFAQFHNADSSQNQINIDGNGNFYWTNKGGGTGDVVSTGDVTWSVLDILNAPPGSPVSGDTYLVGTSGTGAWSGHNNEIASWNGSSWDFNTATTGDLLYNDDFNNSGDNGVYKFNGTAWVRIGKLPWLVGLNRGLTNPKFGTFNNTGLGIYTNNAQRIGVSNTGAIKFNAYGSGTNTGTATHNLAVDASGNVIETTGGGGGSSTDTVNVSNVLSFGADSTGATDATAAFNAAMQSSSIGGKFRVYAPHGTYTITVAALRSGSQTNKRGIELLNNIEFFGDGRGKTIIKVANQTTGDTSTINWYPLFNGTIGSVSNVKIHGVSIIGNQSHIAIYDANPYTNPAGHNDTSKHYSVQGIYFKDGVNNEVYDVQIDSCQGFGVEFYNSFHNRVHDSKITTCGNGGVGFTEKATGDCYNNFITNNNSDNVRVVHAGDSIVRVWNNDLSWTKFNILADNLFAGIYVFNTKNVEITGNHIHDNLAYGIDIATDDAATYERATITGNYIYQNGNGGITSGGMNKLLITGNHIYKNGKTSGGLTDTRSNYNPAAIVGNNSSDCIIKDNIIWEDAQNVQVYFIKKWGGTPTPSYSFSKSIIQGNKVNWVADLSHAYDGENSDNVIFGNSIYNSSGTIVNPGSDNQILTLSGGRPVWGTNSGAPGMPLTHFGFNHMFLFEPSFNSTTPTVTGLISPTTSGTATARILAATNYLTQSRRIGYISSATAGNICGIRRSDGQFWRGNATGLGGFYFRLLFGVPQTTSDEILFAGVNSAGSALGATTDISTLANLIGVAKDAADNTFQIMYNDASGTATKENTGISISNTAVYSIEISCAANSSTMTVTFKDLGAGATYTTSPSTNLPANNLTLAYLVNMSNNATASAVAVDIISMYGESN